MKSDPNDNAVVVLTTIRSAKPVSRMVLAVATATILAMTMLPVGCTNVTAIPGAMGDNSAGNGAPGQKCISTLDCGDTEFCDVDACVPLPELVLELGFTDPDREVYRSIEDDMDVPFYGGFQGLSDLYVTVRVSGLTPINDQAPMFSVRQTVTVTDNEAVIHEFTQDEVRFEIVGADKAEIAERRIILDSTPNAIDGREAELRVSVVMDIDGRTVEAERARRVWLYEVE